MRLLFSIALATLVPQASCGNGLPVDGEYAALQGVVAPLPHLSRRAQVLAGAASVSFSVDPGGGAAITVGASTFHVASSFSEPGPRWNNLTVGAPPAAGGTTPWPVTVDRSGERTGTWVVQALAPSFTVRRVLQLHPAPPALPRRILVNDTIISTASDVIGVHVRHHAQLVSGTVDDVQVPGRFEPGMCGTEQNAGIFGGNVVDYDSHATAFGVPHIWMNTTDGAALGMSPLDDVFRVHAASHNFAKESLNPRVAMSCPVTSPPSIRLSDPYLGLAPNTTHTLEWAIYPQSRNCSNFFCFINALRHDFKTDTIAIGDAIGTCGPLGGTPSWGIDHGVHIGNMLIYNGTGYADPRCNTNGGPASWIFCPTWTNWSAETLTAYAEHQGINVFPSGPNWRTRTRTAVYGSEFVYGDLPDLTEWLPQLFGAATRANDMPSQTRPIRTSFYFHAYLSTGINDSTTYSDSRVLDKESLQVVYVPNMTKRTTPPLPSQCPMFYGTPDNSYGKVLTDYVDKVFRLGFDTLYHDEYGVSKAAFTYDKWDNHSVFFHPNMTVRAQVGSLVLLTMPIELKIQDIVRSHGGFFVANGPPVTRTIIERGFGHHYAEDPIEQCVQHVQLYTPIMMTRAQGQGRYESDPKYFRNSTEWGGATGMYDPILGVAAMCWNILNHLDAGVLADPYEGMFPKRNNTPTILSQLYPITVTELGEGFVVGTDKVLTKASGVFQSDWAKDPTVLLYEDCFLVATATIAGPAVPGVLIGHVSPTTMEVAIKLEPTQQALILWKADSSTSLLKTDDDELPRGPDIKSPVSASGPLNVRSFGAKGDGTTDDTDAIQKAIDQAQQVSALSMASCHPVPYEAALCALSRPVYFPAGLYVVTSSLRIAQSTPMHFVPPRRLSLRLYGDGMHQSAVVAGAPMDAVLRFEGHGPPRGWGKGGNTTSSHAIENMRFDAASLANYSVAAAAITRSQFRSSYFSGARIAGLFLGYGWINSINGCYFVKNLIGLHLDNAVNSVSCVDGNFETNFGAGVIVNSGAAVRLEGNDFESMGGPAIIANGISALSVRSNYFEANNLGGPPENASIANQEILYFDLVSGRKELVCTDILLNGNPKWGPERSEGKSPLVVPGPDGRLVLAPIYLSNEDPCTGVVIAANSHAPFWVNDFCPGANFAGALCAGCDGVQASSSHCGGCIKASGSTPDRICEAMASGPPPNANSSLADMMIQLNTGDFALPISPARRLKSDDLDELAWQPVGSDLEAAAALKMDDTPDTPRVVAVVSDPIAVPSSLPTNSTATRVYIVGSDFSTMASPARCTLAGVDWELDAAASASVPATVHNATHASCMPPRIQLGGSVELQLGSSARVDVPLVYYPLLSASVARHPYTSEASGAVLLRVEPVYMAEAEATSNEPVYMAEGHDLWRSWWMAEEKNVVRAAWAVTTAAVSWTWSEIGQAEDDPYNSEQALTTHPSAAKSVDVLHHIMTKILPAFYRMKPHNELLIGVVPELTFCLAEPERHYLIYSDAGAPFRLNTSSGYSGSKAGYNLTWFDAVSSIPRAGGLLGKAVVQLTPPERGTHWVAVLDIWQQEHSKPSIKIDDPDAAQQHAALPHNPNLKYFSAWYAEGGIGMAPQDPDQQKDFINYLFTSPNASEIRRYHAAGLGPSLYHADTVFFCPDPVGHSRLMLCPDFKEKWAVVLASTIRPMLQEGSLFGIFFGGSHSLAVTSFSFGSLHLYRQSLIKKISAQEINFADPS
jgi:hypothetical protein